MVCCSFRLQTYKPILVRFCYTSLSGNFQKLETQIIFVTNYTKFNNTKLPLWITAFDLIHVTLGHISRIILLCR